MHSGVHWQGDRVPLALCHDQMHSKACRQRISRHFCLRFDVILRPPLTGHSTYRIHLINGYISLHSCQILSPSETAFIVSAQRLTNITLLTLIATL